MLTRYRRTIGSRNMLQKSGIPPGYVFYADLPNYNSQAYGTLTNGSGVATGSPITLAIGNNNVDVTTQGTFTVYVRGSGTATSDVATVSGSPQSLTEGNNTVTVTGTGNIIIALNDTFYELSKNHLLLTNVGGVYGNQGRTLNGDDWIIANDTTFDFERTTAFGLGVWIKTTEASAESIFTKQQNAGSYVGYTIELRTDGRFEFVLVSNALTSAKTQVRSASLINDGTWKFIYAQNLALASGAGSDIELFVNGVKETSVIVIDALDATILTDVNLRIGSRDNGGQPLTATIGMGIVYPETITTQNINQIYRATKWRFGL